MLSVVKSPSRLYLYEDGIRMMIIESSGCQSGGTRSGFRPTIKQIQQLWASAPIAGDTFAEDRRRAMPVQEILDM